MGWSIGYDNNWKRDIGYGVPAYCDKPGCRKEIDRGLSYVCGGGPYGENAHRHGCGLYFCADHLFYGGAGENVAQYCPRCIAYKKPYTRIAPEHPEWIQHKLTDESWAEWRKENPEFVAKGGC